MNALTILIFAIYYFMIYSTVFWLLVFIENRKRLFKDPKPKRFPSVSIIIPAYNEEETIRNAIESCLSLNYPKNKLEIIVVNDGSTDRTEEIVREYVDGGLVKLINKPNTGKADSLNRGIDIAKGELIACLDADSEFTKNALINMIGYFNDPMVGAVTPTLKAKTPKNMIQKIQWFEYIFSIYLRKMMSFLNSIYVTPGPGSIYRKRVIEEVGGFDKQNLVEDTDIALKIQSKGYRIENSLKADVYTETPKSFLGLLKQRLRWYGGYIENILGKHRKLLFNPVSPHLTMFLLPTNFLWIFSLVFLFLFGTYRSLKSTTTGFINLAYVNFDFIPVLNGFYFDWSFILSIFLPFLVIFYAFSLIIIYLSIRSSREKLMLKKKFSLYISYIFLYFPLLSLFWFLSIFYPILRDRKHGWKK